MEVYSHEQADKLYCTLLGYSEGFGTEFHHTSLIWWSGVDQTLGKRIEKLTQIIDLVKVVRKGDNRFVLQSFMDKAKSKYQSLGGASGPQRIGRLVCFCLSVSQRSDADLETAALAVSTRT